MTEFIEGQSLLSEVVETLIVAEVDPFVHLSFLGGELDSPVFSLALFA